MTLVNLFPLLIHDIRFLDTFDIDGRQFAYPHRSWRTEWLFEREPRSLESWARLTHPTSEPIFRAGWIANCLFESGREKLICKICVHDCGHNRDGTFFVNGTVLPTSTNGDPL